jgi:molybdopterin converting factor small subunit
MRIRVRFFAVLREQQRRSEAEIDVAPGTCAAEVYAQLFPAGPDGGLPVMYAVNDAYVPPEYRLIAGDELAFIPPLGGG